MSGYDLMSTFPPPVVSMKSSPSALHVISFTSNWNFFVFFTLPFLTSMKLITSSRLLTASVCPSGCQHRLMLSPVVATVWASFPARASHSRTVLSPPVLASVCSAVGSHATRSAASVWPCSTTSGGARCLNVAGSMGQILTSLSWPPLASLRPVLFHATESTFLRWPISSCVCAGCRGLGSFASFGGYCAPGPMFRPSRPPPGALGPKSS
mmetsp:Transcript_24978/g.85478  ORF Transcript_24978/g.85478 Transcript_24978/m.85478 type:complete len:210 (-) Transcript_24978:207-836(-)